MKTSEARPFLTRFGALCGWFLAATFLYAGVVKVLEPEYTRTPITFVFPDLGSWLVTGIVATVAAVEVWLGTALVVHRSRRWPAVIALACLIVFTVATAWMRAKGFKGDCGCATPLDVVFGRYEEVPRNAVLAALALIAALSPRRVTAQAAAEDRVSSVAPTHA